MGTFDFSGKNVLVTGASSGIGMAVADSFAEKLTTRKSLGEPEDLIGAYLLLASEAGKNINGADIIVDGGMSAGYPLQVTEWVFGSD